MFTWRCYLFPTRTVCPRRTRSAWEKRDWHIEIAKINKVIGRCAKSSLVRLLRWKLPSMYLVQSPRMARMASMGMLIWENENWRRESVPIILVNQKLSTVRSWEDRGYTGVFDPFYWLEEKSQILTTRRYVILRYIFQEDYWCQNGNSIFPKAYQYMGREKGEGQTYIETCMLCQA